MEQNQNLVSKRWLISLANYYKTTPTTSWNLAQGDLETFEVLTASKNLHNCYQNFIIWTI